MLTSVVVVVVVVLVDVVVEDVVVVVVLVVVVVSVNDNRLTEVLALHCKYRRLLPSVSYSSISAMTWYCPP